VGRHHRHFSVGQFQCELVFLQNLRVAPAPGAVKLGHHRAAALQHHLEDAVFIGVQLQDAAVAALAHGVQCVQHVLGCEVLKYHAGGANSAGA
jgi:hypothetical protein